MYVGDLLNQVSRDLNDHCEGYEFLVWSKEQLSSYVLDALHTLYEFSPESFVHNVVHRVQSNTNQQVLCGCKDVRRVIGQCDEFGNIIRPLPRRLNNDNFQWFGNKCDKRIDKFTLEEYSVDDKVGDVWVYPLPPVNLTLYIKIECSSPPSCISDEYYIDDILVPSVIQWVLYRAKLVDGENNQAIASVAQIHLNTFWQLVAVFSNKVSFLNGVYNGRATNKS